MTDTSETSPQRQPRDGRASSISPARRQELIAYLRRHLENAPMPRAKHSRLQHAILAAISDGILNAGDQLLPEPDLADAVGLSLGTVRRCLMHLSNNGVISREHGRGTFVSGVTLTENEVWHMRFLEEDLKTVRPIFQRILSREITEVPGEWSEHFGYSESGYIRVQRAVNVDSHFICHSDFYLPGDKFMAIMEMDPHEIESVGLKHVMTQTFNIPIIRVLKTSQITSVPRAVSNVIRVEPGHLAQRIEVRGYSYDNQPISYQVIWIPPTDVPLDLSGAMQINTNNKG